MDVRFINPFMASIKNVFTTMLGTDIIISKPRLKERDESRAEVSAIIGFSGDVVGSAALCFSMKTAAKTASKFAGEELGRDHSCFADALGELANMVAGHAKSKFQGVNASISLPRVIVGRDMELLESESTPVLVLPCDSGLGRFTAEVMMAMAKKEAPSSSGVTASANT